MLARPGSPAGSIVLPSEPLWRLLRTRGQIDKMKIAYLEGLEVRLLLTNVRGAKGGDEVVNGEAHVRDEGEGKVQEQERK